MKFKKIILLSLLSLSLISPIKVNADVYSDSDTYGLEDVDTKINDKMKNLKGEPTFNIYISKDSENINKDGLSEFKNKKLPNNSILLAYSEKTKDASIILGSDLKNDNIVTENLLNQMYSEYGMNKLKLGKTFEGLEELSDSIFYQLNRSSLGTNEYNYDAEKKAKEDLKNSKIKKEQSKQQANKLIIISGISTILLALIVIVLSNKNSFVSKMIFKNKKDKQLKYLLELGNKILDDKNFIVKTDFNYLQKQYLSFNLKELFDKIKLKDKNTYLNILEKTLDTKDFGELENMEIEPLMYTIVEKNEDTRCESRHNILIKELYKIYPKTPKSIFKTVEFTNLLNRVDFSKESVENYISDKTKEYEKLISERTKVFDNILNNILNNIQFDLNDDELNQIHLIKNSIVNNYHKDVILSDIEFEKKYENEIYNQLSKIRLSKLNESPEIIKYLREKISNYDLSMSSDKMLERQINKAKLLM